MNKQIKDLAVEAGFNYTTPNSTERWEPFLSVAGDYAIPVDKELQAFSDLLIVDILTLIANIKNENFTSQGALGKAADLIKQRFGGV